MRWTEAAWREYRRARSRYASDMTDREWALAAPFMPPPRPLGRPRTTDPREVMNAILYIATTGCQWVQLPKDFPPYSTVQRYFYDWRDSGLSQTIRFALAMETRELEGREASPRAGVIDSQSVKATESGGLRGFDAGKKVKGRKRHIVVDTIGLLFGLVVHAADIQDRDGAPAVLRAIRHSLPDLGSGMSSRTEATPARNCATRSTGWATGHRRSSNDPTTPMASRSCRAVGGRTNLRLAWAPPEVGQGLGEIHRLREGVDQRRPYPCHDQTPRKILLSLIVFRVGR